MQFSESGSIEVVHSSWIHEKDGGTGAQYCYYPVTKVAAMVMGLIKRGASPKEKTFRRYDIDVVLNRGGWFLMK